MEINENMAHSLAKDIVMALAQAGALPVNNSTAVIFGEKAVSRGTADGVYLATLVKTLAKELQQP
ncbi:hypothetical protein [Pusillimonas sp. NJUB218]|uniref:hypothetical protein n=1 Tax=Pusillimonas sp. NJUB218 TaxID=2023230 RepID=UPI000F4CABA7|nr:hypothetical protein [Pusillimonas sp. NJUB218]ROT45039.1 hypothetical protein CHR62_09315 [Pusillimonas sp. NJUB218]